MGPSSYLTRKIEGMERQQESAFITGLIAILILVIGGFFYCLAQHRALAALQRQNRRIAPGLVWLQFIPLLGQIWQIFVVFFIADSFRAEIESHRDDSLLGIDAEAVESFGKRPTLGLGVAFSTTWVILIFFNLFHDPSAGNANDQGLLGAVPGLVALVSILFFVLYWVRLVRTKRRIVRSRKGVTIVGLG